MTFQGYYHNIFFVEEDIMTYIFGKFQNDQDIFFFFLCCKEVHTIQQHLVRNNTTEIDPSLEAWPQH